MNTKPYLFTCFFFLFAFQVCFVAHSQDVQTGSLSGYIKDAKGEPLAFATVGLQEQGTGTTTDEQGFFEIDRISFGRYTLVVSLLGYQNYIKTIHISDAKPAQSFVVSLQENSTLLEDVVISGSLVEEVKQSESAVPIEVYKADFFKANPTPSVFESLQNVNGVRPQLNCNVCNTGDIHINGLEGPYTMVLLDGMPIVSGLSTVYGLTGIPQGLIERVEIVKGPASTLYGSEAVGGLINIITKSPENAAKASVDMFVSSWGEANTDVGVSFEAGKQANSLVGISYFNYQNPIDKNNDGFTDITLQDRISVFNKWNIKRKNRERELSLAGRYMYEDRWGGQMNWNPEYRGGNEVYGESIYTSRWEGMATYRLPTQENLRLQLSANGHHQNSVYGDLLYIARQHIGFGQLIWNKKINARQNWLMGATYRYTRYDDNTAATATGDTANLQNMPSVVNLPGLFVQSETALTTQSKLLLGLRYDYNDVHGHIITPRINYKWTSINKKNTIRLSGGNGYRVANVFTEDHAALTGARTLVFADELKPETSWNGNINFVKKIFLKDGTFIGLDAGLWHTYFTNRIIPDYETNSNQIIYDNLDGSSVSQGVSLNMEVSWTNGLKIIAGATVMDVSVTEAGQTRRQLLTEQVTGTWNIGYTFAKAGLTVDYTGNLYGPMRLPLLGELDNRPAYSPWFSIQNIQLTKNLGKRWQIYGGIKNLLNYLPPANSIARAFDPFDRGVTFGANGEALPAANNPNALTFDPSYVFAPNQGIRSFAGVRFTL